MLQFGGTTCIFRLLFQKLLLVLELHEIPNLLKDNLLPFDFLCYRRLFWPFSFQFLIQPRHFLFQIFFLQSLVLFLLFLKQFANCFLEDCCIGPLIIKSKFLVFLHFLDISPVFPLEGICTFFEFSQLCLSVFFQLWVFSGA